MRRCRADGRAGSHIGRGSSAKSCAGWRMETTDTLLLKHACSTLRQSSNPVCGSWSMEEPSQFSVGQTAQSLTSSIIEKPHTGLDDCLRMLQACFRKKMSVQGGSLFHAAIPSQGYDETNERSSLSATTRGTHYVKQPNDPWR